MNQLKLIPEKKYAKRKQARAISLRGHNHIVFKAHKPFLRRHHVAIKGLIKETQRRYGLKLKALAIQPDHIHLLAKVPTRVAFANAMRFLAAQVARKINKGKLWKKRVWSRTVTTLGDLQNVSTYVWRNPFRSRHDSHQDCIALQDGWLVDEWAKAE